MMVVLCARLNYPPGEAVMKVRIIVIHGTNTGECHDLHSLIVGHCDASRRSKESHRTGDDRVRVSCIAMVRECDCLPTCLAPGARNSSAEKRSQATRT